MTGSLHNVTLLVTRNGLGQAEPSLGHKLASSFFDLLDLEDRLPGHVCFYAEGVKLACAGSPILETLSGLVDRGVKLVVCSTCLQYYELEADLRAGEASNMRAIQAALWDAGKVITL